MNEGDGHCTLTDGGSDPFDGIVPHIPGGKGTGDARFEEKRLALNRSAGG